MLAFAASSLYAWAYVSEQQPDTDLGRRYAWMLLALSASLRVGARALRADRAAALTESLDAYALATLGGLKARADGVSPLWESLLFALSLQAERALHRLAGVGLQAMSVSHP